MPFLVYLFLLFLSMHACTSRPLGVIDNNQHYLLLSDKAVKLSMKEIFQAKNGESIIGLVSEGGTKSMEEIFQAKNDGEVLQEKPNFRGSKSLARSTLESPVARDTEESVKSKEDEPVEDVVVMDYAQPHRKTPIHNKAP